MKFFNNCIVLLLGCLGALQAIPVRQDKWRGWSEDKMRTTLEGYKNQKISVGSNEIVGDQAFKDTINRLLCEVGHPDCRLQALPTRGPVAPGAPGAPGGIGVGGAAAAGGLGILFGGLLERLRRGQGIRPEDLAALQAQRELDAQMIADLQAQLAALRGQQGVDAGALDRLHEELLKLQEELAKERKKRERIEESRRKAIEGLRADRERKLQALRTQFEQERMALQQDLDAAKAQIGALTVQLNNAQKLIDALQKELLKKGSNIEELSREISALRGLYQEVESQNFGLRLTLADHERTIGQLQWKLYNAGIQEAQSQDSIKALQAALNDSYEKLGAAEAEAQGIARAMDVAITRLEQQRDDAKARAAAQKLRAEQAEADAQAAKELAAGIQKALDAEQAARKADAEKFKQEFANVQAALKQAQDDFARELQAKEKDIEKLQRLVVQLDEKLRNAKQLAQANLDTINRQKATIRKLQQQLAAAGAENKDLQNKISQEIAGMQAGLADARKQQADLQKAANDFTKQLKDLAAQLEQQKKATEAAEVRALLAEQERDQARAELQNVIADNTQRMLQAQGQLADARGALTVTQNQLAGARSALADAEKANRDLTQENMNLTSRLVDALERALRFEREADYLFRRGQELVTLFEQRNAELQDAVQTNEDLRRALGATEAQLIDARNLQQQLEKQAEEARKTVRDVQQQSREIIAQLENDAQAQLIAANMRADMATANLFAALQAPIELQQEIARLNDEIKRLGTQNKRAQDALQKQLDEVNKQLKFRLQQVAGLQAELDRLEQQQGQIEQQVAAGNAQIQQQLAENRTLRGQLRNRQRQLDQRMRQANQSEQALYDLTVEYNQLVDGFNDLVERHRALVGVLAATEAARAGALAGRETAEGRAEAAEGQVQTLQQQLAEITQRLKKTEEEKRKFQSDADRFKAVLQQTTNALKEASTANETLRKKTTLGDAEIANWSAQNKRLVSQIGMLQFELNTRIREAAAYQRDLQQLQARLQKAKTTQGVQTDQQQELVKQTAEVASQIDTVTSAQQAMSKEIEGLKQQLADQGKAFAETLKDLQAQHDKALTQGVAQAELDSIANHQKAVQELRDQIVQLQQQLADVEKVHKVFDVERSARQAVLDAINQAYTGKPEERFTDLVNRIVGNLKKVNLSITKTFETEIQGIVRIAYRVDVWQLTAEQIADIVAVSVARNLLGDDQLSDVIRQVSLAMQGNEDKIEDIERKLQIVDASLAQAVKKQVRSVVQDALTSRSANKLITNEAIQLRARYAAIQAFREWQKSQQQPQASPSDKKEKQPVNKQIDVELEVKQETVPCCGMCKKKSWFRSKKSHSVARGYQKKAQALAIA